MRPKNWVAIKARAIKQASILAVAEEKNVVDLFEAGADAMLKSLKEEGEYFKLDQVATIQIPTLFRGSGWAIFIPEEEDEMP